MKKRVLHAVFMVSMCLLLVSIVACGGGQGGTSSGSEASSTSGTQGTPKDSLVVAISSEPTSLNPYAHSLINGFIPAPLIFDTLIVSDGNGGYKGGLATSWEFESDTKIVFKLRDDVTFHNGNPFTAEDVRQTLVTGAESTFSNTLFACIDTANINIIDDHTIEVNLKYSYAPLLEVLSSFRASIIDAETYTADPAAYGRNPVGTGPMKMSRWISGDRIELEANTNYWGTPVSYSTCIFRVIVEATSRTIELETGGIDIASELAFSDWRRVESAPNLEIVSGRTNNMTTLVFNNSYEFFKDEKVRKALTYGIDREALVQVVWEGKANVATSFYSDTMLGYKAQGPYEYNVEKAKALLAEAGYPNGFTFTYTTYETALNKAFSEVLQSMWAQIGVTMRIDIVDVATFTSKNNGGTLTAALLTPNIAVGDPAVALILYPITRTISLRHGDPHVQDLLDRGASTYDIAERVEIYQELQEYLYEKTYTVPIAYPTIAFGIRNNVENFRFSPSQVPDLRAVSFK